MCALTRLLETCDVFILEKKSGNARCESRLRRHLAARRDLDTPREDDAGDGLIQVASGAGGHAGTLSPFALVGEVRKFFDGPLALALSGSKAALAAKMPGPHYAPASRAFNRLAGVRPPSRAGRNRSPPARRGRAMCINCLSLRVALIPRGRHAM